MKVTMILRRRYVVALLLAVATGMAIVAVSAIRSSSPAAAPRVVPFQSGDVTAVLGKLATPAGFTRGPCAQLPGNVDTVCFRRPRSIVLDPSVMAGLVASFGVKLDGQVDRALGPNAAKPSSCHPARRYAIQHAIVPRLSLIACNVLARLGSQHLIIFATSLVLADARSMVGTTRAAPHMPGGSQIAVTDVGS